MSHRIRKQAKWASVVLGVVALLPVQSDAFQVTRQVNWTSDVIQTTPTASSKHAPVVTSARLQPMGTLVAVVGDDHIVNLYDRQSGRFTTHLSEHTDWVRAAEFSPNGKYLATAGNDRRLLIWDMPFPEQPRELTTHPEAIVAIAFSHDGKQIATVGFEKTVRVYDFESGRLACEFESDCNDLRTVAFSPDDAVVAVGGRNGVVQVWDMASRRSAGKWAAHSRRIRSLAFTSDRELASCGDDGNLTLVNLERPGEVTQLTSRASKLFAVCSLPGGMLATAGSDNRIYVWSLETHEDIGHLTGHTGTVTTLDAENGLLLSGSFDTRIRFWRTEKVARATGNGEVIR